MEEVRRNGKRVFGGGKEGIGKPISVDLVTSDVHTCLVFVCTIVSRVFHCSQIICLHVLLLCCFARTPSLRLLPQHRCSGPICSRRRHTTSTRRSTPSLRAPSSPSPSSPLATTLTTSCGASSDSTGAMAQGKGKRGGTWMRGAASASQQTTMWAHARA